MTDSPQLGCVILAAGSGKRFGSNKLAAEVNGKSLLRHVLEAIPAQLVNSTVVVTQNAEFSICLKEFHFTEIRNNSPELGQSHSMHLGLQSLSNCGGILFSVADQPLLRQETVARLIALWRQNPNRICALAHGGTRGNPCIFPARFFPELLAVTGDRGGSAVIRQHPESLLLLEAPAEELQDVDTVQELETLQF